jgi:hypothetical protein
MRNAAALETPTAPLSARQASELKKLAAFGPLIWYPGATLRRDRLDELEARGLATSEALPNGWVRFVAARIVPENVREGDVATVRALDGAMYDLTFFNGEWLDAAGLAWHRVETDGPGPGEFASAPNERNIAQARAIAFEACEK